MSSVRDKSMISIIIPIYNVESYIEDCLKSVASQTCLKQGVQVECILVDDCGTDQSVAICEKFIENYDGSLSFKLLHHDHNRGLSAARNTGMEIAQGEYVFFLDSDDKITPDCLEKMWQYVISSNHKIDMVVGKYQLVGDEQGFSELPQEGIYNSQDVDFHKWASSQTIYVQAWNKLFRKSFIEENGFLFPEGLNYEDVYWSTVTLCKMKSIAVVSSSTYLYLVRRGSILRADGAIKRAYHSCQIFLLLQSFVFENGWDKEYCLFNFIDTQFRCYYSQLLKLKQKSKTEDIYKKLRILDYWNIDNLKSFGITKSEKILHLHRKLPFFLGKWWYNKVVLYMYSKQVKA